MAANGHGVGERAMGRTVLRLTGEDRESFLQNLVTNDVGRPGDGLAYAALLTPQGKYLADFFLLNQGDAILLDVAETLATGLVQRLSMYKLRAAVEITPVDTSVVRGLGPAPDGAYADPRHPAMGWRAYGVEGGAPEIDFEALRVEHLIPKSGIELLPNETYILETGFEALSGVDFKKGCYVGQEVTARMKHKTELKKGLARVSVQGPAEPGSEITSGGKVAGTLHTRSGDRAIAYLRFDRAEGEMSAGDAVLKRL